eukprot:gene10843-11995_t
MTELSEDSVKPKNKALGDANSSEDEELDALLDDALKDFSNPDILCPQGTSKQTTKTYEENSSRGVDVTSLQQTTFAGADANPDELLSEECFAKIAEQFSKAFESAEPEDVEFLKKFHAEASQASAACQGNNPLLSGATESKPSLDENLQEAWSSLEQNMKNVKNEPSGDMFDGDFMNAMKGLGIDEADGPEGLMSMMQGMMTNLLSKDILYPSLKEIQSKYPAWLDENRASLSNDDFERYTKQQELVSRICVEFEAETEQDSAETKKQRLDKIMVLMQEMQACGQPPFELLDQTADDSPFDPGQSIPGMPNPDQCVVM